MSKAAEKVAHPNYYGGADDPYEAIKVIEAWQDRNEHLTFSLLTAVKYLARAGKKDDLVQDLEKCRWYIDREIARLKGKP